MNILPKDAKILVTGVLTPLSLGWQVAELALLEGAQVAATYNPRHEKHALAALEILQQDMAEKGISTDNLFPLALDITSSAALAELDNQLSTRWGNDYQLQGIVHSVAFAPKRGIGDDFLGVSWDDVAITLQVSTYTLPALVAAIQPRLKPGAGVVALTFDAKIAWPNYSWMGVAKGALESAVRYLARTLGAQGVRVNAVAAGPIYTVAANAIPGFTNMVGGWEEKAPLGWDSRDPLPVARSVITLLGDWLCATTGEILHVDGGYHSQGA